MQAPADSAEPVLVFYDGICHLCSGTVQFLLRRDKQARLRYVSLQSAAAARLLAPFPEHLPNDHSAPESILVLYKNKLLTESDAALLISRTLPWPWKLAAALWIIPRFIRNPLYRWIARNRYRWFGKRTVCMLSTPEHADRFITE